MWAIGGLLSFAFAACGFSDDNDGTECALCPDYAGGAVRCHLDLNTQIMCSFDQEAAATDCVAMGGSWVPMPLCPASQGETGSGPGNGPWSPSREVEFDPEADERVIDQLAFEELKHDPTPLLGDSSHLRLLESGYYRVAAVGELVDALGWEEDDVLLDVNGYSLEGPAAFAAAYADLAEETSFRLTVTRDRSKVTLRYRVE